MGLIVEDEKDSRYFKWKIVVDLASSWFLVLKTLRNFKELGKDSLLRTNT